MNKLLTGLMLAGLLLSYSYAQDDLDLPVLDPKSRPQQNSPTTIAVPPITRPTEGPDEKDPRDEPPPVFYGEEIDDEGGCIVFVLDRSGSMDETLRPVMRGLGADGQMLVIGEDSPTRMESAKRELIRCINSLAPNIKFNVYAFDCATVSWSYELRIADGPNKASACAWVNALISGGATGTGPATAMALGAHRECVSYVLLTDGEPNCGFDSYIHRRMINDANVQRASITVFGISARDGHRLFCQWVASDSGGSYYDVN